MSNSVLGTAVRRIEDAQLLTDGGTYVDDIPIEGVAHVTFVRSPYAHADISGIDVEMAREQPGVVAIFTSGDLCLPAHHGFVALNDSCRRPPLADGRVRFVGEAVAVVVAETKAQAVDASEFVVVDYVPRPSVVDPEDALLPSAVVQFDELGTNLVAGFRSSLGATVLEDAEVVVRGRFVNQRVAVTPIEANAVAVVPGDDGDGWDLTIHVSTQMPHTFADMVADLFELDRARLRVITPHVGGAFGAKAGVAHEHTVAIAVARKLGRAVKWIETRSENMIAMPHARAQVQYIELGLRRDGIITGLRWRVLADSGAYAGLGGALALGATRNMSQGVYRIPRVSYDAAVAVTNTTPVGALRGAGRPEATAGLERLIDLAADELDVDPVELRRRNLVGADEFPYKTVIGPTYDTGDYARALDEAVRLADYDDLRGQQAERRRREDRLQLGIGISTYVEITAPAGLSEWASVEVHADGGATIKAGSSAHGQGHATSFAMIVSDRLGIPVDRIRLLQSDTAIIPRGWGTGGSRSLQIVGSAVQRATDIVLAQARELASRLLEASPDDIVLTDGRLAVAGVPSSGLTWEALAEEARREKRPLAAALDATQEGSTFPFGAHISVVEVDVETGLVRALRHIAVDDCGRIINPMLVRGQQHGGIAQGMAQALWEQFVYDADGNPLTSSFADYAIPSAAEFCSFVTANTETPTSLNPLGAKGIGESGTIGSIPAVQNAVVDAVSHLGVRHIDMPCTPERVWRAIQAALAGSPEPAWRDPPAVFESLPVRSETADTAAVEAHL